MSGNSSNELPVSDERSERGSMRARISGQWGVVGSLVVGALGFLGPALIIEAIAPLLRWLVEPLDKNVQLSVVNILVDLLIIGIVIAAVKLYGRPLGDIGLIKKLRSSDLGLAIVGFGVYVGVTIAIGILSAIFTNIDQDQAQVLGYNQPEAWGLIGGFVALVILTPVAEEMLFRGFMFTGFRRRLSFWPAALLVSVLFGIAHGQWNVGLDVLGLSLVSCYLREKSKSLWPSIILHAVKNCLAFSLLYIYNIQ